MHSDDERWSLAPVFVPRKKFENHKLTINNNDNEVYDSEYPPLNCYDDDNGKKSLHNSQPEYSIEPTSAMLLNGTNGEESLGEERSSGNAVESEKPCIASDENYRVIVTPGEPGKWNCGLAKIDVNLSSQNGYLISDEMSSNGGASGDTGATEEKVEMIIKTMSNGFTLVRTMSKSGDRETNDQGYSSSTSVLGGRENRNQDYSSNTSVLGGRENRDQDCPSITSSVYSQASQDHSHVYLPSTSFHPHQTAPQMSFHPHQTNPGYSYYPTSPQVSPRQTRSRAPLVPGRDRVPLFIPPLQVPYRRAPDQERFIPPVSFPSESAEERVKLFRPQGDARTAVNENFGCEQYDSFEADGRIGAAVYAQGVSNNATGYCETDMYCQEPEMISTERDGYGLYDYSIEAHHNESVAHGNHITETFPPRSRCFVPRPPPSHSNVNQSSGVGGCTSHCQTCTCARSFPTAPRHHSQEHQVQHYTATPLQHSLQHQGAAPHYDANNHRSNSCVPTHQAQHYSDLDGHCYDPSHATNYASSGYTGSCNDLRCGAHDCGTSYPYDESDYPENENDYATVATTSNYRHEECNGMRREWRGEKSCGCGSNCTRNGVCNTREGNNHNTCTYQGHHTSAQRQDFGVNGACHDIRATDEGGSQYSENNGWVRGGGADNGWVRGGGSAFNHRGVNVCRQNHGQVSCPCRQHCELSCHGVPSVPGVNRRTECNRTDHRQACVPYNGHTSQGSNCQNDVRVEYGQNDVSPNRVDVTESCHSCGQFVRTNHRSDVVAGETNVNGDDRWGCGHAPSQHQADQRSVCSSNEPVTYPSDVLGTPATTPVRREFEYHPTPPPSCAAPCSCLTQQFPNQTGVVNYSPASVQTSAVSNPGAPCIMSSGTPCMMPGTMMSGTMMPGTMMPSAMMPGFMGMGPIYPGSVLPGSLVSGSIFPGSMVFGSMVFDSMIPNSIFPGSMVSGSMVPTSMVSSSMVAGEMYPRSMAMILPTSSP